MIPGIMTKNPLNIRQECRTTLAETVINTTRMKIYLNNS